MSERHLTAGEVALGRSVYGDAIDYGKVLVTDKAWGPLALFGFFGLIDKSRAHTPDGKVHMPGESYSSDYSKEPLSDEKGYGPARRTFIHELAHVIQYQQGENVAAKSVWNRDYDYGRAFKDVPFKSLGTEQRAAMTEDYYALKNGDLPNSLTHGYSVYSNYNPPPIGEYEKRLPPYVATSPELPDQAPIPKSPKELPEKAPIPSKINFPETTQPNADDGNSKPANNAAQEPAANSAQARQDFQKQRAAFNAAQSAPKVVAPKLVVPIYGNSPGKPYPSFSSSDTTSNLLKTAPIQRPSRFRTRSSRVLAGVVKARAPVT
ncbi:hypothetical protein NKI51_29000 [Mesorhizobium australicum]|uniref:hypothetical protein n=1 Tax=Mesorhizobium australicum TaxID=536018 RepID=UPI003336BD73